MQFDELRQLFLISGRHNRGQSPRKRIRLHLSDATNTGKGNQEGKMNCGGRVEEKLMKMKQENSRQQTGKWMGMGAKKPTSLINVISGAKEAVL